MNLNGKYKNLSQSAVSEDVGTQLIYEMGAILINSERIKVSACGDLLKRKFNEPLHSP
jgi:hypothetical protein